MKRKRRNEIEKLVKKELDLLDRTDKLLEDVEENIRKSKELEASAYDLILHQRVSMAEAREMLRTAAEFHDSGITMRNEAESSRRELIDFLNLWTDSGLNRIED